MKSNTACMLVLTVLALFSALVLLNHECHDMEARKYKLSTFTEPCAEKVFRGETGRNSVGGKNGVSTPPKPQFCSFCSIYQLTLIILCLLKATNVQKCLILACFCASNVDGGLNAVSWRWLSGQTTVNAVSIAGISGEFDAKFTPGGRYGPGMATSQSGLIYLFGGRGFSTSSFGHLNDLWVYNGNEWAWLSGQSSTVDDPGQYTGANACPSGRRSSLTWFVQPESMVMFGGVRDNGRYSDVWWLNTKTLGWTWMKGSSLMNCHAVYGTMGVSHSTNTPGCVAWPGLLADGIVFGGLGFDSNSTDLVFLSDTWSYGFQQNEWTWLNGEGQGGKYSVGGPAGTFDSSYHPGGRRPGYFRHGDMQLLYLYGGSGYSTKYYGSLADFWVFSTTTSQWAYISGESIDVDGNAVAHYGSKYDFGPSNQPGNRGPRGWIYCNDLLVMFGGYCLSPLSIQGRRNDLWAYNTTLQMWAWIGGDTGCSNKTSVIVDSNSYSAMNWPGSRNTGGVAMNHGNVYMFGGSRAYIYNIPAQLNDLWTTKGPICTTPTPTPSPTPSSAGTITGTAVSILLGATVLLPVAHHVIMPAGGPSMIESAQYAIQLVDMFQFASMTSQFDTPFPGQYQLYAKRFSWSIPIIPVPFIVNHRTSPTRRLLDFLDLLRPEFGDTTVKLVENNLSSMLFWIMLAFAIVPVLLTIALITRRIILPKKGFINEPLIDDVKALIRKMTYSNLRIALICYYGVWVAILLVFSNVNGVSALTIAMAVLAMLLVCLGMVGLVLWVVRHYSEEQRGDPTVSATWGVFYIRYKASKPWFVVLEMVQKFMSAIAFVLVVGLAQPIILTVVYSAMVICLVVWRPYKSRSILIAAILKFCLQVLFAAGNVAMVAYGKHNLSQSDTVIVQSSLISLSAISMALVAYMCFSNGLKHIPGLCAKLVFILPPPMRRRYRSMSIKELDIPLLVEDDHAETSLRAPSLHVGSSAPPPGDHDRSWSQRQVQEHDMI